jgi:catechol 2,3-dioxygenase-like lactoylglutathione lyase family enzyme
MEGAMLDHIIITVEDYAKSREFYEKALAPLGYQVGMEFGEGCGFSVLEKPDFWIRQGEKVTPRIHVAFTSRDHEAVDAFYAAALAAGGTDNGAPGLREDYHPNYYGAFVLDPDGHNIEAVCHRPQ